MQLRTQPKSVSSLPSRPPSFAFRRTLRDPLAFGSFMVAGAATAMTQAPPATPLLATGGSVKWMLNVDAWDMYDVNARTN